MYQNNNNWKERLVYEYCQLKDRIKKLRNFITKIENGKTTARPKSRPKVLIKQLVAMELYLEALEQRCKDEGIVLPSDGETIYHRSRTSQ